MALVAFLGASLGIEIAQAQTPPLCVPQKPSASATTSATRCVDAEAKAAARQAAQEQAIAKLSCPTLSEVQRRNLCRRAGHSKLLAAAHPADQALRGGADVLRAMHCVAPGRAVLGLRLPSPDLHRATNPDPGACDRGGHLWRDLQPAAIGRNEAHEAASRTVESPLRPPHRGGPSASAPDGQGRAASAPFFCAFGAICRNGLIFRRF